MEVLLFNLVVHILTTGLQRVTETICFYFKCVSWVMTPSKV